MGLSHRIPTTPWRASSLWAFRPRLAAPLAVGLGLFGLGEGLLVQSHWGATPRTVFAQGVARHAHVSIGWATAAISCAVLLAWFPLRERPGFGTLANLVVIAYALDLTVATVPVPAGAALRAVFVVSGVVAIGVGSALYLTTGLGPGPRDGLMTGLNRRLGVSVVYVRLSLEVLVLLVGWWLGGTVGVGTAVFAATIGFAIGASLQALASIVRRVGA
ncbi:MAG: YitT family protein [Acidimicrobiales bacterium]